MARYTLSKEQNVQIPGLLADFLVDVFNRLAL